MKFAYADPPYIGQAKRHYGDHPDYAGEVDHKLLIERLNDEFPEAWALSASSPSLREILPMCPADARVMPWIKPFCSFKPNVGVAYAWEPIIVRGGRKRTREQLTVRDWVSSNIELEKGLSGVKPMEVCFWLFQVVNMNRDDELHDLFPGSGAVTAAWQAYRQQMNFFETQVSAENSQEEQLQIQTGAGEGVDG